MNKWVVIIIGTLVFLGVAHYIESMDMKIEEYTPYDDWDNTIPMLLPLNQYWIDTSDLEDTFESNIIRVTVNSSDNDSSHYVKLFYEGGSFAGWLYDGSFISIDDSPFDAYVSFSVNGTCKFTP
jgi:hypothetical protein